MYTFTEQQTPATIVKIFPKASDLFKEKQIDYCCGGDKPLRETFHEGDYNAEAILSELNTAYQAWQKDDHELIDWDTVAPAKLIDHIVETHHGYLKNELNPIGEFVTKIYRVHGGDKHPHLQELYRTYNEFKMEMEEHMILEENDVFPLIKEYEMNPSEALKERIIEANGGLEDDHESAGNLLKEMHRLTNGFTPPADACGSYRITYARLAELESNTFEHVHLENNVLFKQI